MAKQLVEVNTENVNPLEHQQIYECGVSVSSRTIFLTGEITNQSYVHVAGALTSFNQTRGDIKLVLNSVGGEVPAGYAIYELISGNRNKVDVYGIGQVMSIAAAIIQGGRKRYMTPLCRFMIHNGSVSYDKLDVNKIDSQIQDVKLDTDIYYDILQSRSNLSKKKVKLLCDQETYLTAGECLEMGFIDAIAIP